ncbi:hypothetical protein [Pseudomonas putida]|uniref:hypothetical protein n=1 Tax=Pseudomonas putida TaxID=303 RepID=UPI0021B11657|nr:hypothetical protein [Pseudomonas putida]
MTDPMHLPPKLPEYRWALYCRSDLLDLAHEPAQPMALYRDEQAARRDGQCMWPNTFRVIDLHGEDSPCGNQN